MNRITTDWCSSTTRATTKKNALSALPRRCRRTCAYYDDCNLYNFLNCFISETVARRKKSIDTFLLDYFIVYNFCPRYFYDETHCFAENSFFDL